LLSAIDLMGGNNLFLIIQTIQSPRD